MDIFKIFGTIAINNVNANKSIDDTNDKAKKAAKEMQKNFETVGNVFKTVGEKIGKVGVGLTATVTTGVTALATVGIKYNAQIEQYQKALTTLTGDAQKADKIIAQIKKDAAATPFDVAGLTQANQLLISTGLSADESRETILALGDAVSATGGGNDELSRMAVNLQQIKNTGKATALDIKQFAFAGIDIYGLLADYTGKTKKEVADMEVTWDLLNGALIKASKEGGKYFGAMQAQSTTINGRISTLKDNFSNLIGKVTESLVPVVEKVLDKASELIEKFSNLDEKQREQIVKWAGIAAAIGPVLIVLGKITTSFSSLFTIISKIIGSEGIAGLAHAFTVVGPTIAGLAGPIALVAAGLVALVIALGGPKKALEKLKEGFETAKAVIQNFLEKIKFSDKLKKIQEKLKPLVEKIANLKDLFKVLGTIIGVALLPAISTLFGVFNGLLSAISPLIDALGGLIDILAGLGSFIVAIFTGDLNKAGESIKKIFIGIVNLFGGLWNAVKEAIRGFVDGVIGFFKGLWDTLVGHSIVPDTINSIIDWFKELLGKPIEFVKQLKDKVINFFINLKDGAIQKAIELKDSVVNKFNNLKDGAIEKFNFMKNKVSSIFNSIKDNITRPIRDAKDKVSEYINSIKSFFTNFSAKIKLPHFNIKNASLNPADWIKNGLPKLSVDWYAKAMDYGKILNKPTIFGMDNQGQYLGAGEVGSETVVGTESLMKMIQSAVNSQNIELNARLDTLIEILLKYLPILINRKLCLDSGSLVGELIPLIDKELGDLTNKKGRGR